MAVKTEIRIGLSKFVPIDASEQCPIKEKRKK